MTPYSQYLDDSSDVHLGDHLSGVEEHEQSVQCKRHILQRRVVLKGLWGVHTHRYDTDDSTGPQQRMNPLQQEDNDKMFHRMDSLTAMSFKQSKVATTQHLENDHLFQ